jgi:alpha-tubulin suppressor-like RCC1 family protein
LLCLLAASLALVGCGGDPASPATPGPGISAPPAPGGGTTSPITILSAPSGQSVADGQSAVLAVAATSPTPLTYQWQRGDKVIEGATSPMYVTPALTAADSGVQFAVVVGNADGTTRVGPATVTVNPVAPAIAAQPQAQAVRPGQQASFSVVAGGSQPLHYQWQRDGADIAGATAASFTTAAVSAADAGARYRVVVRNPGGEVASAEALLSVDGSGPMVLAILQIGVAAPGQNVTIAAMLAGQPPFTYQWLRNGQPMPGAFGTSDETALSIRTGPLTAADDGVSYALTVDNAEGRYRSPNAVIAVVTPPQVAAGGAHSLARSADGRTVWAWGDNRYGQLGLGSTVSRATPAVVDGLSGVRALAAAADHSLALMDDGSVWAWGRNAAGALGDGTQTDRLLPQRVAGLGAIVAVAAADGRSYALQSDGSLWAWGENSTGALGIGSRNGTLVPTAVGQGVPGFSGIVAVAAGARHGLALRFDGRVFAFGEITGMPTQPTPALVDGLGQVAAIAAGGGFSTALDIHGRLWSWGVNGSGQLGTGDAQTRSVPALIARTGTGAGLLPTLGLAAGQDFALARALDGSVLAWGAGAGGQLGAGEPAAASALPRPVGALTSTVLGVSGGRGHALAVRSDGTVYAWGANAAGQLGIGSSELRRTEPVQIPGLNVN